MRYHCMDIRMCLLDAYVACLHEVWQGTCFVLFTVKGRQLYCMVQFLALCLISARRSVPAAVLLLLLLSTFRQQCMRNDNTATASGLTHSPSRTSRSGTTFTACAQPSVSCWPSTISWMTSWKRSYFGSTANRTCSSMGQR
jgi:hypothetical protein